MSRSVYAGNSTSLAALLSPAICGERLLRLMLLTRSSAVGLWHQLVDRQPSIGSLARLSDKQLRDAGIARYEIVDAVDQMMARDRQAKPMFSARHRLLK